MNVVHHGEIGDIIYSLCAVKAMGGCDTFYLRPGPRCFVRERMEGARVELIRGLLEMQPYVGRVSTDEPPAGAVPLDSFRRHFSVTRNLADSHLEALGLPVWHRDEPWLEPLWLQEPVDVVFSRSPRFRNQFFPWRRVWEKYHDRAVFIGLPEEHANFEREVGPVRYEPTADFVAVAQYICSAKLFVGNSSSPLAIAEAYKKDLVEEVSSRSPTTVFLRKGAVMGYDDSVVLPDLTWDTRDGFKPEWQQDKLMAETPQETIDRIKPACEPDYSADPVVMECLARMGLPDQARVLDFGAGMLRNSVGALERWPRWEVTSYDSAQMLERGATYWGSKADNLEGSDDWTGLSGQKFDAVFAAMCFQHIPPVTLKMYLRDLKRMTKRLLVWGRNAYDDYQTVVWDVIREAGWEQVAHYHCGDPKLPQAPETHHAMEFKPA